MTDLERLEEDVRIIEHAKEIVLARGYIWGDRGEELLNRKTLERDFLRETRVGLRETGESR